MRSNFWKSVYGITTFGESHGKGIGVVIEDVKPGITFPLTEIQEALNRRKPGKNRFSSARDEPDNLEVISGVFNGKTTGMPICLMVYNKDAQTQDYSGLEEIFRPEHADLAYFKKFKIFDHRGGGRASGRETIARVIAGSFVNSLLKDVSIRIYPLSIGDVKVQEVDRSNIYRNPLYWPCTKTYNQVLDYLSLIKEKRDSVGGIVEVKINNIAPGLGDPVFEKLDANLAKAILSIGSVKGIEFGLGYDLAKLRGSEVNQSLISLDPESESNSGGIYGGISTGEPIVFRFIVKPTPSIGVMQQTINRGGEKRKIELQGRFDTCIIPRIIPVADAMIKLVIADALSYQRLIQANESGLDQYREAIDKLDEDILIALSRRKRISDQIVEHKNKHNIDHYKPEREKLLLQSLREKAINMNLDKDLIDNIWKSIFENNRGIVK